MSVPGQDPTGAPATSPLVSEQEERSLLISSCQFDAERVQQVDDHASAGGVSFTAAAIELEFVTSREVELILRTVVRQPLPRERAVVLHPTRRRQLPALFPKLLPPPLAAPGPALAAASLGGSARGEALRDLRTELLLRTVQPGSGGVTLAVLSPARSEGRTLLAAELAITLAQLGRSVVLVDADLRRPTLRTLFTGVPECRGLAESLLADRPPQAFGVAALPTLAVVPAGAPSTMALELLSGDLFRAFLLGCRERYEFTLIDTPAADECTDAVAVASVAGNALLALRAGASEMARAEALLERLEVAGTRVLGATLSHF
jgi:Mrp family chromosome partitioning ATPase